MTPDRREILEQVARGELSPEDADRLLREESEAAEPPPPTTGIATLKISAGFGSISIDGDEGVAEVEIDGRHTVEREGDVLVVHGEEWTDLDFDRPGAYAIHIGGGRKHRRGKTIRLGGRLGEQKPHLSVRMNPNIELDVRLDAGSLSVCHVHAPIRARLAAGPITIDDFTRPLDLSVNAGAIRAVGILTEGDSRIRSDAGAVRVELDPSSSVRIMADAALGRVVLPGQGAETGRRFGSRREATVGAGDGTLRVETAMGTINVTTWA